MKHRLFAALTLLVLLVVIVAPAAAAPLRQEPETPFDPVTGEEIQTFVEFGPPDAGGPVEAAPVAQAPVPFAMAALARAAALPAGDLPSYDEEALGRFDVQKSLESDRYLAVDIGPRVTGTAQEQAAAEYFGAKLASYGYTVSYQHWAAGSTKWVATVTSPDRDLLGDPGQTLGGPNWQMTSSTSAKITGDAGAVQGDVIYCGNGQSGANFPADTAGKIVMMDYSSSSTTRNTAVVNAVSRGAMGVILVQTGTNAAPPSAFTLTTPQPNVPVVGGGRAHGDWIKGLIATAPLTLRIATFSYPNPQGTNVVAERHAVNDPAGTTAPIIMVGGHIDGVVGAPAAHDNGTGPSTAVEIGRILAQYALDKEIRVVGYGGEEIGMYGSKAYVAGLPAAERARFVGAWDMDMEGTPYAPARFWMLTPDGQPNFVVQSGYDSAARFGFTDIQNCRLGQSDHQSFFDAGIPASLFIWIDYRPSTRGCGYNGTYVTEPQYHRPTDTMSNVSVERMEISLKVVGGAAFHSALNLVTLTAPAAGATIEANCGDGQRYFGETDGAGNLVAAIPHATCDFKATSGAAVSRLDDAAIAGDASLAFPPFVNPPSVAAVLDPAAPNGNNGWYTGDVWLSWNIDNGGGAVTLDGCQSETFTTDGVFGRSCTVTNWAGTAGPVSVTIQRDATPPELHPAVSPNPVLLNGAAVASPNATDNLSGVAFASCDPVVTGSAGAKTVACTAIDLAGNPAQAPAAYNVTYAFTGFARPVDNAPALNTANSGQAIPLKWRIADANGAPVTDLASVVLTAAGLACPIGATPDQVEEYAAGGSGLQNLGNGYYQFNWKTPKSYAKSCKTAVLDLGEGPGMGRIALFQFVK